MENTAQQLGDALLLACRSFYEQNHRAPEPFELVESALQLALLVRAQAIRFVSKNSALRAEAPRESRSSWCALATAEAYVVGHADPLRFPKVGLNRADLANVILHGFQEALLKHRSKRGRDRAWDVLVLRAAGMELEEIGRRVPAEDTKRIERLGKSAIRNQYKRALERIAGPLTKEIMYAIARWRTERKQLLEIQQREQVSRDRQLARDCGIRFPRPTKEHNHVTDRTEALGP
jgi:hypothetical protein